MRHIVTEPAAFDGRINGRAGEVLDVPRVFETVTGNAQWRIYPDGRARIRVRLGSGVWDDWSPSVRTLSDFLNPYPDDTPTREITA